MSAIFANFRGLSNVKPVRSYLLFATLLLGTAVLAQSSKKITMVVSFPDSIQIVLENTRNTEAMVVGSGLPLAWNNLGPLQQQRVQQQFYAMKRKGYKIRPHFVQYFGSLVNAVNVERADPAQISSFLDVMDKVIAQYRPDKALKFLANTNSFFKRHALYYDKTYRLYARDDRYTFDFIEFLPPPVDTTAAVDWNDNSNWNDTNPDEFPVFESKPYWETQEPPPLLEGPVIRFESLSLNFVTAYDSVVLSGTKGSYSLLDNRFVGAGGRFDWAAAGLNADDVYATLEDYWFDVRKPQVTSRLVRLNYAGKTPSPVAGTFEFRSVSRKPDQPSSYPRFTSYENNISMLNIGPANIRYIGGLSLQGSRIKSTNVMGDQATIVVADSLGGKRFTARSNEFVFNTDKDITADKAEITIYQRNDSIRHPSVHMRYDIHSHRVILTSEKGSLRNTPYSSSFFNVDFSAALIRWNINADSLEIYAQMTGSTVPMVIESIDYYHPDDTQQLQGIGFRFHPLMLIGRYCIDNNTREVYGGAIAQTYGLDIREVQKALTFLEAKGLVEYAQRQDRVIVKEKAITQYLALKGEADYDNLKITSQPGSYAVANLSQPRYPNATVNFTEGQMVVRGVEKFSVSDSLNVMVEPDSSVITLLQNRDIKFNGVITAGNFEIHGKKLYPEIRQLFHQPAEHRFHQLLCDGNQCQGTNHP
jgi:hypothetical protein